MKGVVLMKIYAKSKVQKIFGVAFINAGDVTEASKHFLLFEDME